MYHMGHVAVQLSAGDGAPEQDAWLATPSEQQRQRRQGEEGTQGSSGGLVDRAAAESEAVGGVSSNGNGSGVPDSFREGRGQY